MIGMKAMAIRHAQIFSQLAASGCPVSHNGKAKDMRKISFQKTSNTRSISILRGNQSPITASAPIAANMLCAPTAECTCAVSWMMIEGQTVKASPAAMMRYSTRSRLQRSLVGSFVIALIACHKVAGSHNETLTSRLQQPIGILKPLQ